MLKLPSWDEFGAVVKLSANLDAIKLLVNNEEIRIHPSIIFFLTCVLGGTTHFSISYQYPGWVTGRERTLGFAYLCIRLCGLIFPLQYFPGDTKSDERSPASKAGFPGGEKVLLGSQSQSFPCLKTFFPSLNQIILFNFQHSSPSLLFSIRAAMRRKNNCYNSSARN